MSHLKLTRIEIENFRRFRAPFVLDLVSPSGEPLDYVVLAGPNGSGKTTVLEAIHLLLGREDRVAGAAQTNMRSGAGVAELDLERPITAWFSHAGERISYQIVRTQGYHRVCVFDPDSVDHVVEWEAAKEWFSTVGPEYISSRRVPALVGPVQDAIRGRPPEAAEANRIWTFKHRVRQQQGRRVPGYKGPEPLDRAWLERLNEFWRFFRNDATYLTMTLVDPENLDANEWDLFLYDGDRRICSVDALSSGEQEIIAMIAPFITERFDGLLLLDEPELHMHPQWQGRVLRALRKAIPGAQVIVSTHADDPWDAAMSWERFLLVPDDDPRARVATEAE